MIPITAALLRKIMPGLPQDRADLFAPHLAATAARFDISTAARVAAFLAQAAHESAELAHLVENLNYSAPGLLATWPAHFTAETAMAYARQPVRIANRAYANRMGNGDEASGDGWLFRGRGVIGRTGRDAYRADGVALGMLLEAQPDLVAQPEAGCLTWGVFWQVERLGALADAGDFVGMTRRINGRLLGLPQRLEYFRRAKWAVRDA